MILFHTTTEEAAQAIITYGFKDATGTYGTRHEYTGVWFSNIPLDANEGPQGEIVLKITTPLMEEELNYYEWKQEGISYREWLIPSEIINKNIKIEIFEKE